MRFRLTRPAMALSVVVAAIALVGAPLLAVEMTHTDNSGTAASELYTETSVQSATPAVARVDQRDTAPERAAKHRLVLVAVLAALVATPVVLRAARPRDGQRQPPWPAAASPFSGRAPPQLTLHCA